MLPWSWARKFISSWTATTSRRNCVSRHGNIWRIFPIWRPTKGTMTWLRIQFTGWGQKPVTEPWWPSRPIAGSGPLDKIELGTCRKEHWKQFHYQNQNAFDQGQQKREGACWQERWCILWGTHAELSKPILWEPYLGCILYTLTVLVFCMISTVRSDTLQILRMSDPSMVSQDVPSQEWPAMQCTLAVQLSLAW